MAVHIRSGWVLAGGAAVAVALIGITQIDDAGIEWFFSRVPETTSVTSMQVSSPPAGQPTPPIEIDGTRPSEPAKPKAAARPFDFPAVPLGDIPDTKYGEGVEQRDVPATRTPLAGSSTPQPGAETRDAQVIERVTPEYSAAARRFNLDGIVRLEAQISASGTVESVRTLSGNQILASDATAALRQWRYAPALREGVAVPSVVRIEFVFKLR